MLRQIELWVQNEPYHKERSFASNYFNFEILFQFKNIL